MIVDDCWHILDNISNGTDDSLFASGHPFDYKPDHEIPDPCIGNISLEDVRLLTLPQSLIEVRALPMMQFRNIRMTRIQTALSATHEIRPTRQLSSTNETNTQGVATDRTQTTTQQCCSFQVVTPDKRPCETVEWSALRTSSLYSRLINVDDWRSIELYWNDELVGDH